jgi:predicted permease
VVFRDRREADLDEELRLHLEREAERLQRRGMSREQGLLQARRSFGGVEQVKEQCRDARGTAAWDALVRDTRYGTRRLARDWRFSAAAVLILGLAIGTNTAVFSGVNAVLFRGQPRAASGRLVNIYQNDRAGRPLIVSSYDTYQAIAEQTGIFEATRAGSLPNPLRYLQDGTIRSAAVEVATASYLDVLGLHPSVGRWFEEREERPGAPVVGVLGYRTWSRVFGGNPAVVGRVIRLEGVPVTIVGVGPENHHGTIDIGLDTDLWVPITALPAISSNNDTRTAATIEAPLLVTARLREGVTVARAQAAMDVLGRRLEAEHPDRFRRAGELAVSPGMTVIPSSDVRVHPQADRPLRILAASMLVIVGLVLAIACSNLTTLMLVRGAARAREVSVRLAIGATRRQLVRQLLIESVLISLAGGVAGCVLAWGGIHMLQRIDLPFTIDLTIDYRVLAFAVALSFVTGAACGLAPALRATRVDLVQALRDEGLPPIDRRRLTLKNALIVVQVAVSVLLLGGTGIVLQMLQATRAHRVGYAVDGVAMLETDMRFAGYSTAAATTTYERLLRRVQAIPGVESAALLRGLPMDVTGVPIVVDRADGQPGGGVRAVVIEAGPGLFETLKIRPLYGRVFDARDRAGTPRVAVITEAMAQRYFGAPDAVGRRFRLENEPGGWTEVIGVVPDTGTGDFADDVIAPIAPAYYRSYTQTGAPPTTVIARTSGDAGALVAAMQGELRAIDVTLPVVTASTMSQMLERSQAVPKAVATVLGVLGGLGLALAGIGLYAVVAFAVARRSREIGIRMALGARSHQVVSSVARGVAGLMGIGTGAGLLLSALLTFALRAASGPGDIGIGSISVYRPEIDLVAPLVIAGVTAAVGVAAAFVPARRAARLDPLVALRHE